MNLFSVKKVALAALVGAGFMVSGCLTDDKKDTPADTTKVDTTAKDTLQTKTVTLGAQTNATAGSIDLDTWTSYTTTQGVTKYADIDIIFAFSTSSSQASIYSPNIAKNGVSGSSGGFAFLADWPNANTTPLKIPATAFDVTKIKTSADIKAAYDAGSDPAVVGKVPVSVGTFILVKTDKGLYVLVKVTAVTAAADGTVNLTGWAKW